MGCLLADLLDGALARMLNEQSEFGKELDSLADALSFGAAPAYLYLQMSPEDGIISFLPSCLFVACGALRLAKFNTLAPSKNFIGLPIPSAAAGLMGICIAVYFGSNQMIKLLDIYWIYASLPLVLGLMMLSSLEMFSLKSLKAPLQQNVFLFLNIFIVILSLIFVSRHVLWIGVLSYILLSLTRHLLGFSHSRMQKNAKV